MNRTNSRVSIPGRTLDEAAAPDGVLAEILLRGDYCCVVAPAAVGALLRIRTADRLRAAGCGEPAPAAAAVSAAGAAGGPLWVATLKLRAVGSCPTAEEWYERLLADLASQLVLADELAAFWQEEAQLSPLQRWIAALREVVLAGVGDGCWVSGVREGDSDERPVPNTQHLTPNTPRLVLFIEEIEAVRELLFSADEFFSAIRECYNRRARDPELRRLTFCLMGTERLTALIRDPATTWFNIGRRLELDEEGALDTGTPRCDSARRCHPARVLLQRARDWMCGEPYWVVIEPVHSVRRASAGAAALMLVAHCPP